MQSQDASKPRRDVEARRAAFKRVAERRVNKVLYALRVLSNCSNRAVYEYSDRQVEDMFTVIEKQVGEVRSRFRRATPPKFEFGSPE